METTTSGVPPMTPGEVRHAIAEHWRLYLSEGILLIILGAAAIILPTLAGLATAIFLGWLFLIAGIAGLVFTFGAKSAPGFIWSLLSALAALVAGALLLWNPLGGLVTLTYVLIGFFIVDGAFMSFYALAHRHELSSGWGWMLANGLIDFVLAALVLFAMPGAALWALGLIVGIDMLFGGASLAAVALAAHNRPAR